MCLVVFFFEGDESAMNRGSFYWIRNNIIDFVEIDMGATFATSYANGGRDKNISTLFGLMRCSAWVSLA